jgi:predicted nucleic acid-binding protein
VQTFINKYQSELGISLWVKTEFYGVLGRRVRDGGLPLALAERAAKRFEQHHHQGLYSLFSIDARVFEQAAHYTRRFQLSIKSPDAIHLSVVQLEQLELITSDQGLASFAKQLNIPLTLIK